MNQQRCLAKVIIETETSQQQKGLLRGVTKRYNTLYQMDVDLRNKRHFSSSGRADRSDITSGDAMGEKKNGRYYALRVTLSKSIASERSIQSGATKGAS